MLVLFTIFTSLRHIVKQLIEIDRIYSQTKKSQSSRNGNINMGVIEENNGIEETEEVGKQTNIKATFQRVREDFKEKPKLNVVYCLKQFIWRQLWNNRQERIIAYLEIIFQLLLTMLKAVNEKPGVRQLKKFVGSQYFIFIFVFRNDVLNFVNATKEIITNIEFKGRKHF